MMARQAYLPAALVALLMACGTPPEEAGAQGLDDQPLEAPADTAQATRTTEQEVNGFFEVRTANGDLLMRGPKVDGQRHGMWTSLFPNGMIRSRGVFDQGLRHGGTEVYHENGMTYYIGQYHRGNPSGEWVFYGPDGEREALVRYDTLGNILERE